MSENSPPSVPAVDSSTQLVTSGGSPLRIWPAILLLCGLLAAKTAPLLATEFTPLLFQVMVFGPIAVAIGTLLWWLLASRAGGKERVFGTVAVLAIAGVASAVSHKSLHGFGVMIYILPTGVGVVLLSLILFGRSPSLRGPLTLLLTLCGFGVWDVVRHEGVSGTFQADFHWRWTPTAEQQFLATLSKTNSSPAAAKLGEVLWSEFRGPRRDGVVTGVALDPDWSTHPPREIWRHKIGPAWSSFVMAGDQLFTQEQRGDSEVVACYRASDGSEEWTQSANDRFWESVAGAGPRATPTLYEGHLYTLGAGGLLQRLDPLTGHVAWQKDLRKDADRQPPMWGFSSSPLIAQGTVFVHAGGKGDNGLLGYDAETGDLKFQIACGDHSYSSAQLTHWNDREIVLMVTNRGLTAVDAASGKIAWDYRWSQENYRVLQPLEVAPSEFLVGTGIGAGTRRIAVGTADEKGDVPIREVWTSLQIKPNFNDFVAHNGFLYGFDADILTCVELETGKRRWKGGRYGTGQVLLFAEKGQLLVLAESGELVLVQANPEKLEEIARAPGLTGKTWNHPIFVGERLYLRNAEEAVCLELARVDVE